MNIPCPNTLGRPGRLRRTSSVCIGLKSPDAPAYITRSVRVSVVRELGGLVALGDVVEEQLLLSSSLPSFLRFPDTNVNLSPSRRRRLRVLREAEDPLADDVALDLAGAAGDRQAAGEEELLRTTTRRRRRRSRPPAPSRPSPTSCTRWSCSTPSSFFTDASEPDGSAPLSAESVSRKPSTESA